MRVDHIKSRFIAMEKFDNKMLAIVAVTTRTSNVAFKGIMSDTEIIWHGLRGIVLGFLWR